MCKAGTNILMVGVSDKSESALELPVRILVMSTGAEAIKCLREEKIDTVVSSWHLIDIPEGKLLKNIIAAKPWMPTIAFVPPGDFEQEKAARSIGVTAVLSEDVDDEYFRQTLCQILRIETVETMKISETYDSDDQWQ
jgi:DNA-binding NtrC family response regulator